jgi:hypothetical protein
LANCLRKEIFKGALLKTFEGIVSNSLVLPESNL